MMLIDLPLDHSLEKLPLKYMEDSHIHNAELNKNQQNNTRTPRDSSRSHSSPLFLPAAGAEALGGFPAAVGSAADGSPTPLSPGRPPPSSAALASPSRQEIKSNDGRRSSSGGGGRWRSAAGMARRGAGSKTYRTAGDELGRRRTTSGTVRPHEGLIPVMIWGKCWGNSPAEEGG